MLVRFVIAVAVPVTTVLCTHAAPAEATTLYVSRNGSNQDGLSWSSAWSELSEIDWSVIGPGDTVLLDGGETEMEYSSTLTLRSLHGTANDPISIRVSDESGHDGVVSLFGGRSVPLPYCGQADYVYETAGVRAQGILVDDSSWLVVDGTKLRGITIHGHNGWGIRMSNAPSNITFRNLELHDNGTATENNGTWSPNQEGLLLVGADIAVERSLIHDNGADAIQGDDQEPFSRFLLRNSWLYNSRKAPNGEFWNYCTHSDGIQIFAGGDQVGLLVEGSVIGPGFNQGLILGDGAAVHDVTIRDTLLYGSIDIGHNVLAKDNSGSLTHWRLEHVTSDRPDLDWHNVSLSPVGASELAISNSIFTGGRRLTVQDGGAYADNCQYDLSGTVVGTVVDPQYANVLAYGSSSLDADFTLADSSPCAGLGASITSGASLLEQLGGGTGGEGGGGSSAGGAGGSSAGESGGWSSGGEGGAGPAGQGGAASASAGGVDGEEGCGCRAVAPQAPARGGWLLPLLAMLLRRRSSTPSRRLAAAGQTLRRHGHVLGAKRRFVQWCITTTRSGRSRSGSA